MKTIGAGRRERPLAWRPMLVYFLFALLVMTLVVLTFGLAGVDGWLPTAAGGAVVGGLLTFVYPWLYDRVGTGSGRVS